MNTRARATGPSCRRRLFAAIAVLAGASAGAVTAGPLGDAGGGDAALLVAVDAGCDICADATAPVEWGSPFFDLDWSLGLRGAYVRDAEGAHYETIAVPAVSLVHETMRGGYQLDASAELNRTSDGEARLAALRAAAAANYQLDALTELTGDLELSLTQDRPGAPGVDDAVATASLVGGAAAEVAVTRSLSRLDVTLRGSGGRTVYGPTSLVDGSEVDNSAQNNWQAGAGLRLGYAVTPILTAFVDGSVGYQAYDLPSPTYLQQLDAADYAVRAGLAGEWGSVLSAEASIGLGLRRFAAPGLEEVASTLYDAAIRYRPDETVDVGASLSTTVGAPGANSGGVARIEYEAVLDASYKLNTWFRLRASAGWRQAQLVGTTTTETGYDAGVGVDYLLNDYATLTADYGFSRAESAPEPVEDEHRFTLGVTFSRPQD